MSKSLTTDRANTGSKYLGRLPFVDILACALFIARGLLFAFIFVREFDKPVGLQLSQERMNAPTASRLRIDMMQLARHGRTCCINV